MKNWKKTVVASALALSLSLPMSVNAAETFPDVGSAFKDEITYLSSRDIIQGLTNGTFGVDEPVTRLQTVIMLIRELRVTLGNDPDPGFTDMKKGHAYYSYVAKLVDMGVIQGKIAKDGSRYFDPNGNLTRGEMAIILTKAYDIPLDRIDYNFKDVPATMSNQKNISALANAGITVGYPNQTFKPYSAITRQEFAGLYARTLDRDFNKYNLQFIPEDYLEIPRPKTVWLTEQQGNEQEQLLLQKINDYRTENGVHKLTINNRLEVMSTLISRIGTRFIPMGDYSTTDSILYEQLFGEKLAVPIDAFAALGPLDEAFNSSVYSFSPNLLNAEQYQIGIEFGQYIDGSEGWIIMLTPSF